ncbi:MAG: ABC transporter substrate-binding protein [Actinomycetota bacterium]
MPLRVRSPRLILGFAALALLTSACSGARPTLEESSAAREVTSADEPITTGVPVVDDTRTLRLAVGDDWLGDPADAVPTAVALRVVAGLLHEGLTAIEADGSVVPALAERWFVSDDRLQWTFVLPEGSTDNLGSPLTARDVKASLERLAERGPADQAVTALHPISGWDAFVAGESGGAAGLAATDDTTLVITLDLPFEPLGAVLADPAFGITGTTADGAVRTTGAYRYESDTLLVSADPDAAIGAVELVRVDGNGGALLAADRVDWAVLGPRDTSETVAGSVIRQPLDLRTGIVVRLAEVDQRAAVLSVLNGAELALDLPNATVAVTAAVNGSVDALPSRLIVHLPEGPLAGLATELEAQLVDAGVEADVRILDAAGFAAAVAAGEAVVFPMVVAGSGFTRSTGVAASAPGGPDDVFGIDADERGRLVEELWAERDPVQRELVLRTLEEQLRAEHVWLPLANAEVRIGLGADLVALRTAPDGTLDLRGF